MQPAVHRSQPAAGEAAQSQGHRGWVMAKAAWEPEGAYYRPWNLYFQSLAVFMFPVFPLPSPLYSLSECVKDLLENSNLSQLTKGTLKEEPSRKHLFVLGHVALVFYFWKII